MRGIGGVFISRGYRRRRLLVVSTADNHIVDNFKINLFGSYLLGLPIGPALIHGSQALCFGNGYHFLGKIFSAGVLYLQHVFATEGRRHGMGEHHAIHIRSPDVKIFIDKLALGIFEFRKGLFTPGFFDIGYGLFYQCLRFNECSPLLSMRHPSCGDDHHAHDEQKEFLHTDKPPFKRSA